MNGEDYCVICGREHEIEDKMAFPKDFPNDWKFCCGCLRVAYNIAVNGKSETIERHTSYFSTRHDLGKLVERISERIEKIDKLISLVKE